MTPDKLKALFGFYLAELARQEVTPRQMDGLEFSAPYPGRRAMLRHAAWTCEQCLAMAANPQDDEDLGAARESLGNVQGLLLGNGVYSLNDLRNHQLGWENLK